MKNKKIFIKFISIFLSAFLLIGLSAPILFKPKNANAQIAVPTAEAPPWAGSATSVKEYIADTAVKAAAKAAVQAMVSNISAWARNGFRGNQPFAIASWENYLKRAIDVGSARFIEEFDLTPLCSPIRITLENLGLSTLHNYQPNYQYYAACTIGDIVGNVEDFFKNPSISKYGWSTWTALAQPQNNIYGSFLLAIGRRAELESESTEAKKTEATVSGGYKNFSECMKTGTLGICIDEQLKTTGAEVHELLKTSIWSDLEWLISADEISELLGAFITGIWNRLLGGLYNIYDPYKDLNLSGRLPPGGEYPSEEPPLPEIPEPEIPELPGPEIPVPEGETSCHDGESIHPYTGELSPDQGENREAFGTTNLTHTETGSPIIVPMINDGAYNDCVVLRSQNPHATDVTVYITKPYCDAYRDLRPQKVYWSNLGGSRFTNSLVDIGGTHDGKRETVSYCCAIPNINSDGSNLASCPVGFVNPPSDKIVCTFDIDAPVGSPNGPTGIDSITGEPYKACCGLSSYGVNNPSKDDCINAGVPAALCNKSDRFFSNGLYIVAVPDNPSSLGGADLCACENPSAGCGSTCSSASCP